MIIVQAYESYGEPSDKIEFEKEFCCWQALNSWLNGFNLYKCDKCKNKNKALEFRGDNDTGKVIEITLSEEAQQELRDIKEKCKIYPSTPEIRASMGMAEFVTRQNQK